MANDNVVKEVRARFTADMSKFRQAMNQAGQISNQIRDAIDEVGETMRRASGITGEQARAMAKELNVAQRAADMLGKRSQDLVAKERQLTRQTEEQKLRLAELRTEYDRVQDKTDGLKAVYDKITQAANGLDLTTPLTEQRKRLEAEIKGMEEAIAQHLSTGSDRGTKIPFNESFLELDEAKQRLGQLTAQLDNVRTAIQTIGAEDIGYATTAGMKKLQEEIGRNRDKLDGLKQQAAATQNRLLNYGEGLEQVRMEQERLSESANELLDRLGELQNEAAGPITPLETLKDGLANLGEIMTYLRDKAGDVVRNGLSKLGSGIKSAAGFAANLGRRFLSIGSSAKTANSGISGMVRSIRNIGLVSVGLRVVSGLFGRLRSVISNYVNENETLKTQVDALKNGLGQALAPAINLAINLFSRLLPYIIGVSNAIGTLLTNLLGKGWTTVADATNAATDAQEDYKKSLAGFDEITKLNDNSDSSGDASSTTATVEGKLPTWLEDLSGSVKSMLEAQDFTGIGALLADKLGGAVDFLSEKLSGSAFQEKISGVVSHVTDGINGFLSRLNFSDGAATIAERFGALIGDGLSLALSTAHQFLADIQWGQLGEAIAGGVNGAIGSLSAKDINFGSVLADWIQAHINGIGGFFAKVKWSDLGKYVGDNINSAFSGIDWSKAGKTLSDGAKGILNSITSALQTIKWSDLARDAEKFVAGIDWGGVASALFEGLGSAIGGIAMFLGTLIGDAVGSIGDYFGEKIDEAGGNIGLGILNGIGDAFNSIGSWVKENVFDPFINGFKAIFGIHSPASDPELLKAAGYIGEGILNGIASAFGTVGKWVDEHIFRPIKNAFDIKGLWDSFKSSWDKVSKAGVNIVNGLASSASTLWSGFKTAWGDAKNRAVSIANSLASTASGLWTKFKASWGSSKSVSIANSLSKTATTLWASFKANWGSRSVSITNTLANTATTLWNQFKSGWSNKTLGLKITYTTNVGAIKTAVYKALGLDGWPTISFAARGGIVEGATLLGNTVVGEAGKEAIIPLENHTEWLDMVSDRIVQRLGGDGGSGRPIVIHNYVQMDSSTVGRSVVTYINGQAQTTGVNPLSAYL